MNKSNIVLHEVKRKTRSPETGLSIHEEFAIKGDKGLTIKYYRKDNNHNEKIVIFSSPNGKYTVRTTENGKTEEKTMSKDELLNFVSNDDRLSFATNIVKNYNPKPNQGREQKRQSRNGSRRGSRYSRYGSKGGYRKYSRSKFGSRKYGSRRSRRGSRYY
jgi:hypothetical protein